MKANRVHFFELLSHHDFSELKLPIWTLKLEVDLFGIDLALLLPIGIVIGLSKPDFPAFHNQVL